MVDDEMTTKNETTVHALTWAVLGAQIVLIVVLVVLMIQLERERSCSVSKDDANFPVLFVDALPPELNALWFGLPTLTSVAAGWSIDHPIVISVPNQQGVKSAFVSWDKSDTTFRASYTVTQTDIVFKVSSWGAPSRIGIAFTFEK